jgi:hypothetical protein
MERKKRGNVKAQVEIDRRFCGPSDSGNGGYTCGIVAKLIGGPAEVILRRPPPLNRALNIEKTDSDKVVLYDETGIIAEASSTHIEFDLPEPPTFSEVENSSPAADIIERHQYPTCFVYGPLRKKHDGLRIFSAPIKERGYLASTWIPDSSLSDAAGTIRDEIIWAALDCPGGWAVVYDKMRPILLGKLAVHIQDRIMSGDKSIIVAWKISEEGRKIITGTALFSESGRLYARAKATWIELKSNS